MADRAAAVLLSVALGTTAGGYHQLATKRARTALWAFLVANLTYVLSIVAYNPLRKRG